MNIFFPRIDPTRLQIALKTCLSMILALAITFHLDWKPSFMAILMLVLQTAAVGATYKKGMLYILGTLSGAIAGVAVVGFFAHDRAVFILAMALLTGFGVYRMQGSRYIYAWLIFIVTLAVTGWLPAQNPSAAFDIAVMRSSTICLGVVVSFSVHGLLWPIRAGKTFENQLKGFLDSCRELVSLTGCIMTGDQPDSAEIEKRETAQIKVLNGLHASLAAAESDTKRFKQCAAGYKQLLTQLRNLLLAIIAVRVDLESCPEGQAKQVLQKNSHPLAAKLKTIATAMEQFAGDLPGPRDGTVKSPELSLPQLETQRPGSIDTAFTVMVDTKIEDLAIQLNHVRATIATVEKPSPKTPPPSPPPKVPFSFNSGRFHKAAVGGLIILLIASFFVVSQWPGGLQLSMIFAVIAIGFSGMMPIIWISGSLLVSLAVSIVIAAPLYLYIMPGISQFEQLIPWLCLVFVPLLYLQTSQNPKIMIGSLFSSIFVIILLSLDEQHQSYAFSTFMNTWLSLCGGFAIPVLIFFLFNKLVPERLFSEQVSTFFSGCGRFMQELKENPQGTSEAMGAINAARSHWQGTLKQLQLWSSMINYKRIPDNTQDKTRDLVGSIERLALRLEAAEYARRITVYEPLREPFYLLYDSCAESCQLIAKSLAASQPVPTLPDISNLVRGIESRCEELCRSADGDNNILHSVQSVRSITTHMNLFADDLNKCREKANGLDWKGWNLNHF